MKGVEIDFETRSAVDLRKRGVYNYMASETTEPLMASYSIDGGPVQRWRPPAPCPADLRQAISAGATISAHNAGFERLLMQRILAVRYGWPMPRTEQFRCTAATAAAMALPRALDDLGAALDLDVQKDKAGKALIQKFSKPRRPRKGEPGVLLWNEPGDNAEDFERFHDYCDDDVRTEAEADHRMVPLPDFEQKFYTLTEIKNDRGIRIDLRSARSALRIAEKAKKDLDREMRQVTGGYVGAVSQPGKLVEWVGNQGVPMNTAQKAEIESLLECDDLPDHVRRAIEIRQEGAKSSVSKLQAMLDRAGEDGRVRGTGIYHAASTGREQSVGVNFNNLPRPRKLYEEANLNTEVLFEAIRSEDPDVLRALYGEKLGRPLHLLSDSIRGFIWAAPGHDLVQADYSGIEGAVIAWSSDEAWKVKEMFEIIADPSRPDMYRQTAAGIMNTTTEIITKKHPLRQSVGKTSELALSFGGGVSAFHSMALNYGVNLESIFQPVWDVASEERREKAVKRYSANVRRGKEKADVLSREAWIGCELVKVGWRAQNSAIASSWKLLEEAARDAIRNPGTVTSTLKFKYVVKLGYLWCLLPSGRALAYASPKLKDQVWAKLKMEDGSFADAEVMDRIEAEKLAMQGECEIQGATSPAITMLGVDKSGKMRRENLYGGLMAENCLGGDTEVLTPYGWKRIIDVRPTDKLWDGVEWVEHDGLVFQGFRKVMNFAGVQITPEHKVWTNEGWKPAEIARIDEAKAASSYPEIDWSKIRSASSNGICRGGREEGLVENGLRLRNRKAGHRVRAPERTYDQLWLLRGRKSQCSDENARHVKTRCVCGMEQHDRSLRSYVASSLFEIRRAWNFCMRSVDEISEFLVGHGPRMEGRAYPGQIEQRRELRTVELRLAKPYSTVKEQEKQRHDRYSDGQNAYLRSIGRERNKRDDAMLPCRSGMAGETHVRSSGSGQKNNVAVYDLLNAGPRNRFTIKTNEGPVIVSNCTQAIARDLLVNGMWKAEAAGYPVIATVYDEIITEVPRGFGDVKEFEKLICELPGWADGLPLTAGGWRGKRYRKD